MIGDEGRLKETRDDDHGTWSDDVISPTDPRELTTEASTFNDCLTSK
jgi:hypothetical protein